jgi:hypothetical protein
MCTLRYARSDLSPYDLEKSGGHKQCEGNGNIYGCGQWPTAFRYLHDVQRSTGNPPGWEKKVKGRVLLSSQQRIQDEIISRISRGPTSMSSDFARGAVMNLSSANLEKMVRAGIGTAGDSATR